MTIKTANLGFPRIGRKRELKFAHESYWSGKSNETALLQTARDLRHRHWRLQQEHGIDVIPSNDFSLYDHVLDHAVMVGAIPDGYGWTDGPVSSAAVRRLPSWHSCAKRRHGEKWQWPCTSIKTPREQTSNER